MIVVIPLPSESLTARSKSGSMASSGMRSAMLIHMDERDLTKSLRGKSTPFLVLADSSGTVRWEGSDIAKAWQELRRSESP
jgi:hypothetical protein